MYVAMIFEEINGCRIFLLPTVTDEDMAESKTVSRTWSQKLEGAKKPSSPNITDLMVQVSAFNGTQSEITNTDKNCVKYMETNVFLTVSRIMLITVKLLRTVALRKLALSEYRPIFNISCRTFLCKGSFTKPTTPLNR
jgi:hypothetical protein